MFKLTNNLILSIIILYFFTSCETQKFCTKLSYFKDKNGVVKLEGITVNDLKTGLWISYNPEGIIQSGASYVNGKQNGEFYTFWDDAKIFMHGYYTDDQIDGPYEQYNDNGSLSSKGQYHLGEKLGKWAEYTYDGRLNRIMEYLPDNEMKILTDNKFELPVPKN